MQDKIGKLFENINQTLELSQVKKKTDFKYYKKLSKMYKSMPYKSKVHFGSGQLNWKEF